VTPRNGPLVSVVVPVFNAADTIAAALQSLLRQANANMEILVVDDGSDDGSAVIAAALRDDRIVVIRRDRGGLVGALRAGCERARGSYVARLDADDVAAPDRIAAQVAYLEVYPHVGLLGTHARIVWPDGREQIFQPPPVDEALRRYLLWDNPFVHSSVMFRRAVYDRTGGYTPGPNEDYRLWIQMARHASLAVLPRVLVTHRIRDTSYSRSMRRSAALRARLAAQWQAATTLGPWHRALPALAVTGASLTLATAGYDLRGRFAGSAVARWRGLRGTGERRRG
jgi:glycosyltransferase involved in cell wall biosynthesis